MSKKGITYAVFGLLQEDGSYKEGKYLSPVANFNGTANASNGKDYGDNRIVETDKTVTGGTLSVELNHDTEDIYVMLLGHKKDEKGQITFNSDDVAPYVGVGAIGMAEDGYVAKFYKKVQFSEPGDDNATKQESVSFGHVTVEGDIIVPEDGVWKLRERFDTLAAAKEWLNKLVGITTTAAGTGS